MKTQLASAVSVFALLMAAPACATVVIGTGAGTIQPDENLLFNNNPANGTTVSGITNQTDTLLSITGGEVLAGNGGQARLQAADGLIDTTFAYNGLTGQRLGFDFIDPALAFTQTEFRIFVGGGTATQATLTFLDTAGQQFQQTFVIPSNGFFNAQAIGGQQINYFSIATNGSFQDVRQIRIGGVSDMLNPPAGVVPEPETWALMILGFGGIGAVLRHRRRRLVLG
jgi:hypothetical protein